MKFTHPAMGNLNFLTDALIKSWGVEDKYVPPSPSTKKTLEIGTALSPEWACLPFKVNIGNYVEMIEKEGVNTIVIAGGKGPCRFGYYCVVQIRILKENGYDIEMIVLEPPSALGFGKGWVKKITGFWQFFEPIKRLTGLNRYQAMKAILRAWPKAVAYDELEREVLRIRCFEVEKGSVNKAWEKAKQLLKDAPFERTQEAKEEAFRLIEEVPKDFFKPFLMVGIIGEFFVLLEPFCNFDIENKLSRMGISVARSVYITDWLHPFRKSPVCGITRAQCFEMAKPELSFVGGEGIQGIAHTKHYGQLGFDGVVHLYPFTCMPDTIVKDILPKISDDYDIPILQLVIDEQTAEAGMITRLEAFNDLMRAKKKAKQKGVVLP